MAAGVVMKNSSSLPREGTLDRWGRKLWPSYSPADQRSTTIAFMVVIIALGLLVLIAVPLLMTLGLSAISDFSAVWELPLPARELIA